MLIRFEHEGLPISLNQGYANTRFGRRYVVKKALDYKSFIENLTQYRMPLQWMREPFFKITLYLMGEFAVKSPSGAWTSKKNTVDNSNATKFIEDALAKAWRQDDRMYRDVHIVAVHHPEIERTALEVEVLGVEELSDLRRFYSNHHLMNLSDGVPDLVPYREYR